MVLYLTRLGERVLSIYPQRIVICLSCFGDVRSLYIILEDGYLYHVLEIRILSIYPWRMVLCLAGLEGGVLKVRHRLPVS
jgi:hypothetical protein